MDKLTTSLKQAGYNNFSSTDDLDTVNADYKLNLEEDSRMRFLGSRKVVYTTNNNQTIISTPLSQSKNRNSVRTESQH